MSAARSSGDHPLVLVDGSNVARCSAWRAQLADANRARDRTTGSAADIPTPIDDIELRQRLVDALCSWASVAGVEVQVVFDGAGPWRAGKVRATADVVVIGSGRAEGDDVLERRAANAHRDGRTYWVVTTDRALQQVAGARAQRVVDADDFVRELDLATPSSNDAIASSAEPIASQVRHDLDEDTLAKLERLRRGLEP
ncbi:MAG: hypothetical protein JWL76_1026 [Thermoleophilia bacterium]|nr:hypothetical protein [Thermoleophilia bacterium]